MGWNMSPYIWQSTIEPILKKLQRHLDQFGVKMYTYLDDILFVGPDEDTVNRAKAYVYENLEKCGFILNDEKSKYAAISCDWLGFTIKAGKLFLPHSTVAKVN